MIYQALARRLRPKDFTSIISQEHVVKALTNSLNIQRLHHAYLFTGTRGVGKTTLSRILSKAINCENGITSSPCNACYACKEIDECRFVDYLEMDAASNRGVDEMTTLLENTVYAPVNARFKVYMIDEAHMLTNHAFNSMLKILEEPPPYLKFILATTDPKKIPATILSRFLQFNLKKISATNITLYLQKVLNDEKIIFELQALRLLARAAQGSIRDALSLTDQAIAYSTNKITEDAVLEMLGAIDQTYIVRIIDLLVSGDAHSLLAIAEEIASRSLSFSTVLQDLASILHRIAWAQYVPNSVFDECQDAVDLRRLAGVLSPEQVQLFYQIAIVGRTELGLAPDEYAGFSMTLLRMLAFESVASDVRIEKHLIKDSTSTQPLIYNNETTLVDTDKSVVDTDKSNVSTQYRSNEESFSKKKNEINFTSLAISKRATSVHKSISLTDQFLKIPVETSLFSNSLTRADTLRNFNRYDAPQSSKLENAEISQDFQIKEKNSALQCKADQEILNDPFVQNIMDEFGGKIVDDFI